jgi:hypothetical protein
VLLVVEGGYVGIEQAVDVITHDSIWSAGQISEIVVVPSAIIVELVNVVTAEEDDVLLAVE